MTWNPIEQHRGPFMFHIVRPTRITKEHPSGVLLEALQSPIDSDDVYEEAQALLADPRDTIDDVYVWSIPEQQCVMVYHRKIGDSVSTKEDR